MSSGKFVLRLDPHLHRQLKEEAKAQGSSLNSICLQKLSNKKSSSHAEVLTDILNEFDPLGVVLFGSAVRGESRESSDIDLLIILKSEAPINRDLYKRWDKIMSKTTKYSPQFVHISSGNDPKGSIWLECSIEGEILYEHDKLITTEFIKIRSLIASGQYQRKTSHGHAYWVKKESNI